ncbi:uncharacterized protein LOC123005534 [Tribolium madens]|uniref:uncharacterized protein LOC123005534 n=1 Tax=Tribolium madens TaxID=41895 RepID=UPI001CF73944|nr:uncharacterized protein LOC123005534 [Tribolium madens]
MHLTMNILVHLVLLFALLHHTWGLNCVAPGTFKEPRDPTCKKYYTCTLVLGMYYVKSNGSCGTLQRFNPTTQQCDLTSICINSYCDNQLPMATLPDPNALNPACRQTYIQCVGITNQYPVIEQCTAGCC